MIYFACGVLSYEVTLVSEITKAYVFCFIVEMLCLRLNIEVKRLKAKVYDLMTSPYDRIGMVA